jgi:maltooligosyltrehalose trehalohydrolase
MGWDESVVPDPQDPATFQRSKLRWEESGEGMHGRMLRLYRELIALRGRFGALTSPDFLETRASADEEQRWFRLGRGDVEILVNFASEARTLEVPEPSSVLLATDPGVAAHEGTITLPPRTAIVVAAHDSR